MRVYVVETEPLLGYYAARSLVREVPGMGSVTEVSDAMVAALEAA
jgi:adenylate kinase family enzyme